MPQTAYTSPDQQRTITSTFERHAEFLALMNKPQEEWTADDSTLLTEYEAWKRERAERQAAEREEKERRRRESAKATRDYFDSLNVLDSLSNSQRDSGSIEWFIQQAQRRVAPRETYRVTNHADKAADYLTQAYRLEVERRGGTLTLDSYTRRAIADVAHWMTAHTKSGLLLRGYLGVGKTTMLRAMATVYDILQQQQVRIVSAIDITLLAKDGKADPDALVKCPMLGIDDLGTEPQTVKNYGNELSPVVDLLTRRYDSHAFTAITTNLTGDETAHRYGERLADRIKEQYNTLTYSSEQQSYRK